MLYLHLALIAIIGTAACLPQNSGGYTRRHENPDLYRRYEPEVLEALALEERAFDDDAFLFERSDDKYLDLGFLYRRVDPPKTRPPPVPPKPAHLQAPKAGTPSPPEPPSGGTDWTKKVQKDAKEDGRRYKIIPGVSKNKDKDKGKQGPKKPLSQLEKLAAGSAKKVTGYTRETSEIADEKNRLAGIKNRKEEEINKAIANQINDYNNRMKFFNTGKDVVQTASAVGIASHAVGLIRREMMRRSAAYAMHLDLDLDDLYY